MRNSEQIRSLTKAADNGCAESAFEAFKELRKYKDSVDAIRESIFYLRKSAYGGHAEAQFYYSEYLKRSESAKLMEQSIEWLKKAADSGYPKAMFYLGCFYKDGVRVRKNRKSSIKWLTLASAYGHVMAKDVLDTLREEGDRSDTNPLDAKKLSQKYKLGSMPFPVESVESEKLPQADLGQHEKGLQYRSKINEMQERKEEKLESYRKTIEDFERHPMAKISIGIVLLGLPISVFIPPAGAVVAGLFVASLVYAGVEIGRFQSEKALKGEEINRLESEIDDLEHELWDLEDKTGWRSSDDT